MTPDYDKVIAMIGDLMQTVGVSPNSFEINYMADIRPFEGATARVPDDASLHHYAVTIAFDPSSVLSILPISQKILELTNVSFTRLRPILTAIVCKGRYLVVFIYGENLERLQTAPQGNHTLTGGVQGVANSVEVAPKRRMLRDEFSFWILERLMAKQAIEKFVKANIDDVGTHDDERYEECYLDTSIADADPDAFAVIRTHSRSHNVYREYHLYFDEDGQPLEMLDVSRDECKACMVEWNENHPYPPSTR